jgi:hypothetical protein
MAIHKAETFPPVTMGHIPRPWLPGFAGLLRLNQLQPRHHAERRSLMPDDTPIRPLGARMVCSRCGCRGADVRPDWSPHVNKRHV